MLENLKITIFGGTGSIGTLIVDKILNLNEYPRKILIFSNSENELWESKNHFAKPFNAPSILEYKFGDIRDKSSVKDAVKEADIVINAAALKHVGYCEESPYDAVKTNILGLINILEACHEESVESFIQISTDKAVEPVSVMGATKLIGERLVIASNNTPHCQTNIIRFGNVLGSRGSLVPQIAKFLERGNQIYISDVEMKRFILTKEEVADFIMKVLSHIKNTEGGLIYIPKMNEVPIVDIIGETCIQLGVIAPEVCFYGRGKAEKLRESLWSQSEVNILHEYKDMYILGELS